MQCNIDQTGRDVRRNAGVLCLVLAAVAAAVAFAFSGTPRSALFSVAAFLVAMGLFTLFEAQQGWCVARAMGFKTKV